MSTLAARPSPVIRYRRSIVGDIGAMFLALAYFLFCVSDTLLTLEDDRSQAVKIVAFVLILTSILLRPRFHKLIVLIVPIFVSLCIGLSLSFNLTAGVEELLRFLFPIVISIALFAYRDKIDILIRVFIWIVVSNDIFQIYFYISYFTELPLFMPVRIDSGLFLRAQGWMGFFSEFSFINFCAFLIFRWYFRGRQASIASWGFLLFALLGFSFKMFAVLAFYPFVQNRRDPRTWLAVVVLSGIMLLALTLGFLDPLLHVAAAKISFYVTAGNSARAESYRVMVESLQSGHWLGEGLGSFGGPSSVKFNSPLYLTYHFNWYGLDGILKTVDTFYPHLFVEMGLFGGLTWLIFLINYGQSRKKNSIWVYIVFAFYLDNFFSMSLISSSYVFSALLAMYAFSWQSARRPTA